MKTIRWYPNARRADAILGNADVLHIEAEGCIVNVHVRLRDSRGRKVTRVDVLPADERRGGDGQGRIWRLRSSHGCARVVQLKGRK